MPAIRPCFVGWLLVTSVFLPTLVFAQEVPSGGYVGGGFSLLLANGPSGGSSSTYPEPPGGTAHAWHASGGAFATPKISIEGELLQSGTMSATETTHYGVQSIEERKDTALSVMCRFHLSHASRVEPEVVAGVRFVSTEGWTTQLSNGSPTGNPMPIPSPQQSELGSVWNMGATGGLDLRIGGPRVAVVPGFRLHYAIQRNLPTHWTTEMTVSFTAGVNVRISL